MNTGMLLVTNFYPFKEAETYLVNESDNFSLFHPLIILSTHADNSEILQPVPPNCLLLKGTNKKSAILKSFHYTLIQALISEIPKILKGNTVKRLKMALWYLKIAGKVIASSREAYNKLINSGCSRIVIYSYWLNESALALISFKKKLAALGIDVVIISRAHGYDLYEERADGYLPFREYILKHFDGVYPVSKNGEQYLTNKYPAYANKIKTSYLGTIDYGYTLNERRPKTLRITSCSNVIKIKRVHLLVEALSLLDIPVEWTHIGDGPLLSYIKELANRKLRNNVKVTFTGRIPNNQVIDLYMKTNTDLFINISETEGLPVTIIEAMSCAIPVIATNVGGTSEIVKNGINGYLLNKEFDIKQLAVILQQMYLMEKDLYLKLCYSARETWEAKFSATKNFGEFYHRLRGLNGI